MIKFYSTVLFFGIIFCSCSDSTSTTPGTDSTKIIGEKGHGLTVNNPIGTIPHAVKDSIYNGEHIERYASGVIYIKGEVAGGLREGEWLSFHPDGKPFSKGIYKAGLRQGYGVSWYPNGQKSSEGNYQDDKPIGKWKYWDEHGNMVEKDFGGQ